MAILLDPKNDYIFKRLFSEALDLLVVLINDLWPDLPNITAVEVLNPNIEPSELTGKYISTSRVRHFQSDFGQKSAPVV
ncbi:hypothetical protein [Halomonas daqiaonensis]|nr:hypothetical protein [Halomonas daqiaonensis]